MKREFDLPATPGLARRLMLIAHRARMELDQAIVDLAATGWLTDDDFQRVPFLISDRHKMIAQQVIDHDFRCILPTDTARPYMPTVRYDDFNRDAAMIAAKVGGHERITVVSKDTYLWGLASKKYKFESVNLVDYTKLADFLMDETNLVRERTGILMLEIEHTQRPERDVRVLQAAARDFPKTMLVLRPRTPFPYAGEILSPGGANRIHVLASADMDRNLTGLVDEEFAVFMNVVPELLNGTQHDVLLSGLVDEEDDFLG